MTAASGGHVMHGYVAVYQGLGSDVPTGALRPGPERLNAMLQHCTRVLVMIMVMCMGLGALWAAEDELTPPQESLSGLRPGNNLTVDMIEEKLGRPDVVSTNGLLRFYGGGTDSEVFGWFMIENPQYTVPDLIVETEPNSNRIDLVMAIGYDGLATEKGLTCFQTESEMTNAYGDPDFAFAVPMNGIMLHEVYYPELGLSFDLAPVGMGAERQIVAIYVTYPEHMQRAVEQRRQYIKDGVGSDITSQYSGLVEA
jgi:hypothetical protein